MKIAIITRPDNRSPKNLALSLERTLISEGVSVDIFYDIGFLSRMVPLKESLKWKTNLNYRIRQKVKFLACDASILKKLKSFDAVILCECIPNAMWRNLYPMLRLKKKIKKPIGLYEVFFLDAAPHFTKKLNQEYTHFKNPFDFELAISDISYSKIEKKKHQFKIGLNLKDQGLEVSKKDELIALLDFEWEGESKYLLEQKKVLDSLDIKYIELKGDYSFEEIREEYRKCSIFFLQHYESFGLPIAECLSYGTKIFTKDSGWPMAFRLDSNPEVYGKGVLPDCFTVYNNAFDLRNKLIKFKDEFDKKLTPIKVFDSFQNNYPDFYKGNIIEVKGMLDFVKRYE